MEITKRHLQKLIKYYRRAIFVKFPEVRKIFLKEIFLLSTALSPTESI